eukprot:2544255-Rhodomonas_salina.2
MKRKKKKAFGIVNLQDCLDARHCQGHARATAARGGRLSLSTRGSVQASQGHHRQTTKEIEGRCKRRYQGTNLH